MNCLWAQHYVSHVHANLSASADTNMEVEDVNDKHYRRRMASDLVNLLKQCQRETKTHSARLVDCAKQIVGLHMSGRIEGEVNYTDGILNIMDSTNWKEE